ncbi:hypothetical protein [Aquirufa sp.]|uniref:hypothetical protein n=1 Tax=Aquirufa sp. TaxID=2676249 RepID=UPI0037C03FAD
MRYVILSFLGLFLIGCQRAVPTVGVIASYQKLVPQVVNKTVSIDFNLSYDSLFSYVSLQEGKVFFDSKNQPGVDFPLTLRAIQRPQVQIRSNGVVGIKLPVQVDARPSIAGINTGLIQAKSNLLLDLTWNWKDINHRDIRDVIFSYSWITQPEMRVLGFPVQVKGIVEPLIDRQIPEIQSKFTQQLSQITSMGSLTRLVNKLPMSFETPFGKIRFQGADIDMKDLIFQTHGLRGKLLIRTALALTDSVSMASSSKLMELRTSSNLLPFRLELSYRRLEDLIKKYPQFKNYQFKLSADTSSIFVKLNAIDGKKAKASIRLNPMLIDSAIIGMQVKSIDLEGVPFFVRGHLKRKINQSISQFRFSGSESLLALNQNVIGLKLADGHVSFQRLFFTDSGIGILGEIKGNWELRK